MATLTTQPIARGGMAPSYVTANAGGDAMECGWYMFLHIKNTNAGAARVVQLNIPAGRVWEPNVIPAPVNISVAQASERMIGPVDGLTFRDPVTGLCSITYPSGGAVDFQIAAIHIVQP